MKWRNGEKLKLTKVFAFTVMMMMIMSLSSEQCIHKTANAIWLT